MVIDLNESRFEGDFEDDFENDFNYEESSSGTVTFVQAEEVPDLFNNPLETCSRACNI